MAFERYINIKQIGKDYQTFLNMFNIDVAYDIIVSLLNENDILATKSFFSRNGLEIKSVNWIFEVIKTREFKELTFEEIEKHNNLKNSQVVEKIINAIKYLLKNVEKDLKIRSKSSDERTYKDERFQYLVLISYFLRDDIKSLKNRSFHINGKDVDMIEFLRIYENKKYQNNYNLTHKKNKKKREQTTTNLMLFF